MREPAPRGSAIDDLRLAGWANRFASYRRAIAPADIRRWIAQFETPHSDLAARVIDAIRFVTHDQIREAYRAVLARLPGWSVHKSQRHGKWRFVALSASAGESGDTMLHAFRTANGLGSNNYNDLFIYKSDLLREGITAADTVVFVDDFSGSGTQACTSWTANIRELLPANPTTYLLLVAATHQAKKRILAETSLRVESHFTLNEGDNILSGRCPHFTTREKVVLLDYNRIADAKAPSGYGECGLVIAFAHKCPNNTIPILRANHRKWKGIFRGTT